MKRIADLTQHIQDDTYDREQTTLHSQISHIIPVPYIPNTTRVNLYMLHSRPFQMSSKSLTISLCNHAISPIAPKISMLSKLVIPKSQHIPRRFLNKHINVDAPNHSILINSLLPRIPSKHHQPLPRRHYAPCCRREYHKQADYDDGNHVVAGHAAAFL